ncbi:YciI family protein [Pseudonocardia sp. TRM90224]|uniref:YciI family protein n=1 Tax=Pseudonocardia sp. TRM90224 TaxID=2812678 RepID=UPI001E4843D1|nr:YciI family protein [Pseudonocardia sp. TRM90224]
MQYMLLICGVEGTSVEPGTEEVTEDWVSEMDRKGIRLTGNRLRPVADSTCVRVRSGDTLLTDGPFAETKEQVLGFDLIECADLDEALDVASRHPVATWGTIEVRPLWTE